MSLLLPVNAVVDVYRGFNAANPYPGGGSTPAVEGARGHLKQHVRHGRFGSAAGLKWTTVLYLPPATDVRSAYDAQLNAWTPANADTIVLPDYPREGWCTAFLVVLVQRMHRGTAAECLRVCLDRLQPRQGGCIRAGCCPDMPATLYATVPLGTGCPCLDGTVVPLTYDADSDAWTGSQTVCNGENFTLTFRCTGTSCLNATLLVSFEDHGDVGPVPVAPPCGCSPLFMAFAGIEFAEPGGECVGGIAVVITV
ncbi:MAG: hypothetical protein JNM56_03290 [Planctomycetia bacterium]|nr:hypothetical protein [Planctomycetia bacterium]